MGTLRHRMIIAWHWLHRYWKGNLEWLLCRWNERRLKMGLQTIVEHGYVKISWQKLTKNEVDTLCTKQAESGFDAKLSTKWGVPATKGNECKSCFKSSNSQTEILLNPNFCEFSQGSGSTLPSIHHSLPPWPWWGETSSGYSDLSLLKINTISTKCFSVWFYSLLIFGFLSHK